MNSEELQTADMAAALALLNPWQRDFPLVPEPYAVLAQQLGCTSREVLDQLHALTQQGALSRIGAVFNANTGGAALLSAMAVPLERLQAVAALVSAHPGVNHNYEREDAFNLWFVISSSDAASLEQALQSLERATGLPALRLRMVKPYRIDLGFDLHARTAGQALLPTPPTAKPIAAADQPLAALVEAGLPLEKRPFDVWAQQLQRTPEDVLNTLKSWLAHGTVRRFGAIVRHHEFGFAANAMTVVNVPDDQVDALGQQLALQAGVTLAYRRTRNTAWPYNLYFMVHGRHRSAVTAVIERVMQASALQNFPHKVLFSRQRFKQTGARRFAQPPQLVQPSAPDPCVTSEPTAHAYP